MTSLSSIFWVFQAPGVFKFFFIQRPLPSLRITVYHLFPTVSSKIPDHWGCILAALLYVYSFPQTTTATEYSVKLAHSSTYEESRCMPDHLKQCQESLTFPFISLKSIPLKYIGLQPSGTKHSLIVIFQSN